MSVSTPTHGQPARVRWHGVGAGRPRGGVQRHPAAAPLWAEEPPPGNLRFVCFAAPPTETLFLTVCPRRSGAQTAHTAQLSYPPSLPARAGHRPVQRGVQRGGRRVSRSGRRSIFVKRIEQGMHTYALSAPRCALCVRHCSKNVPFQRHAALSNHVQRRSTRLRCARARVAVLAFFAACHLARRSCKLCVMQRGGRGEGRCLSSVCVCACARAWMGVHSASI